MPASTSPAPRRPARAGAILGHTRPAELLNLLPLAGVAGSILQAFRRAWVVQEPEDLSPPNRQLSPSSVAFMRVFVVKPDVRPHPVHTPRTSEESGEAPPPLGSEFRSSPSVLTGEAPAPQAVSRPFEAVKTSKAPGNNDKRRAHVSPGQRHNSPPDLPHRVWRTKTSNPRVGGSSPSGRADAAPRR